jgi:hypothetical protein
MTSSHQEGHFAFTQLFTDLRYTVSFSNAIYGLAKHFHKKKSMYAEWFGIPLRLKNGMYGLTLSGKWWSEEFTHWLFAENFEQSKADKRTRPLM